jgi:hypothetical protein
MVLFLLTDGCRAQYRGCKAFEFYSQLNEKYGVCFVHMLGIPHKFKGPHDSFGFVFKDKMNRIILSLPENFTVSSPIWHGHISSWLLIDIHNPKLQIPICRLNTQ